MNYQQYQDLIDKELPHLQVELIPGPPPEIIKLVAVQLFQAGNVTSELAIETQYQLDHLSLHGRTDFSDTDIHAPAEFGKAGFNKSEFQ